MHRKALAGVLAVAFACASPAQATDKRSFSTAAGEAASKVWTGAQDVSIYALSLIGVKYKFGGSTPERGLDCSGLVRYVFQQVTGVTLPRTTREQSALGDQVGMADLLPGDLVFFNTRRFDYSHVGIYLGDNRFIHAPSKGGDVEIATFSAGYWQKRFNGARRLVGSIPSAPSIISSASAAPLQMQLAPEIGVSSPVALSTMGPSSIGVSSVGPSSFGLSSVGFSAADITP